MSARRSNASPVGNQWEDLENDDGYRSSAAPSSASVPSLGGGHSQRAHAPIHFDDANLYQGSELDAQENFKVFIRVRPPVPRELNGYRAFVDVVRLSKDNPGAITLCDAVETEDRDGGSGGSNAIVYSRQNFVFDHVYGPSASQEEVYERSARPAVLSVMEGYNATLMAYGQTGTGKTYTMEGFTNEEARGMIPRSVEEIFDYIRASRSDSQTKFLVRASYMQIYNEVISDLLVPPGTGPTGVAGVGPSSLSSSGRPLTVRHTPQRGVYVDGLSEWIVRSPRDVYSLIERGTANRATSSTKMSELSSRSHAIFTLVVEVLEGDEQAPLSYRFGKLNIVDLAGSEKVRQSGVSGQRLEETKKINRSLHELGNVISALASKSFGSGSRSKHIPFRNSVLTSALRDSLGGNCKTTLIACISPALESYTESLSTLMFANRAKNIRTTAVVNEDMDQAMLLRKYEKELKYLRELLRDQQQHNGLASGSGGLNGDASLVSGLEEDRQRAEEDRAAALDALRRSSQTCAALEKRIRELESMMDEGGFAGGPRTSEEYAQRLQELDRERLIMQEDKAQVDRYKQLLLKQRDIMLNLTTRLNERDEAILQLQEELDAYDAHVEMLEGQLAELEAEAEAAEAASPPHEARPVADKALTPHDGIMSHAEALQYLKECRVPQPDATHEAPRYRSDTDLDKVLSAEDKLLEVLQCRQLGTLSARQPAGNSVPPLSPEELRQLKDLAAKHVAEAAASRPARAAQALGGEVRSLALQLAAAEARLQLYEKYVGLHSSSMAGLTGAAALTQALSAEAARLQKGCLEQLRAAAEEATREREERRRLAREVERLRFEVGRQQEEARVTPAVKASTSRLWQALQALEGDLLHADDALIRSEPATAAAARSIAEATAEKDKAWRKLLEEKQKTIDGLLLAQAQGGAHAGAAAAAKDSSRNPEQSTASFVAAKEAEIAALQKELTIQKKDRRALKTILDQRMKTKVDRMYDILKAEAARASTAGGGGENSMEKLLAEAKSLQTLLNASIKAMDS